MLEINICAWHEVWFWLWDDFARGNLLSVVASDYRTGRAYGNFRHQCTNPIVSCFFSNFGIFEHVIACHRIQLANNLFRSVDLFIADRLCCLSASCFLLHWYDPSIDYNEPSCSVILIVSPLPFVQLFLACPLIRRITSISNFYPCSCPVCFYYFFFIKTPRSIQILIGKIY